MATMGFLSLTDEKDKEEFQNSTLLEKNKARLPKYMQFKQAYFTSITDLQGIQKEKPNDLEWEEYQRWMREVVSFPEQLVKREMGKVSVRMTIWLAFFRLGFPNSKIDKHHIQTERQWLEQGRTPWKYASRVEVPIVKSGSSGLNVKGGSSTWWLQPKLMRIPLKGSRIPTVEMVHRWQTFTSIPEESAKDPMQVERDECLKHVLRFHGRQGSQMSLDDLRDGADDWELEAIEKFASKMNLDGDEDSSESFAGSMSGVHMLEGWLKRKTTTTWKKYWYVVSGGDNVPGMLSEFKTEDSLGKPRHAIFLQDCTVLECKNINGAPAKPFTIELNRRNKPSIYLRCKNKTDMSKWISVLVSYSNILNVNLDLSQLSMAAVCTNEKGKCTDINVAFTQLTGWKRSDIVAKNIKMLMTDEHSKSHAKYMSEYCKRGTSKIMGLPRTFPVKLSSGETMMLQVTLGEYFHKKQRRFFATFNDPNERGSSSSLMTSGPGLTATGLQSEAWGDTQQGITAEEMSDDEDPSSDGSEMSGSSGWVSKTVTSG